MRAFCCLQLLNILLHRTHVWYKDHEGGKYAYANRVIQCFASLTRSLLNQNAKWMDTEGKRAQERSFMYCTTAVLVVLQCRLRKREKSRWTSYCHYGSEVLWMRTVA